MRGCYAAEKLSFTSGSAAFFTKNTIKGQVKKMLKIMLKSAWGSDDPTNAAFPFFHGDALAEAGHEIQIFLLSEAVSLMRKSVADSVPEVFNLKFFVYLFSDNT